MNSRQPRTNSVDGREEDLNLGPPDYKSCAQTTQPNLSGWSHPDITPNLITDSSKNVYQLEVRIVNQILRVKELLTFSCANWIYINTHNCSSQLFLFRKYPKVKVYALDFISFEHFNVIKVRPANCTTFRFDSFTVLATIWNLDQEFPLKKYFHFLKCKSKISAQSQTTLPIQFSDRENDDKNNRLPLGKQICFAIV